MTDIDVRLDNRKGKPIVMDVDGNRIRLTGRAAQMLADKLNLALMALSTGNEEPDD